MFCSKQGSDLKLDSWPPRYSRLTPEAARVKVVTWNVGNAEPPADLSPLLGSLDDQRIDILVMGLQECRYSVKTPPDVSKLSKQDRKLASKMIDFAVRVWLHIGQGFRLVLHHELGEMKLLAFVRQEWLPFFGDLSVAVERTGIAGVVDNKGGIAARFRLGPKCICLISTHLAAHEGAEYRERRNNDIAEILRGTLKFGGGRHDVSNHFHHTVFMGDMNYRLEVGGTPEGAGPAAAAATAGAAAAAARSSGSVSSASSSHKDQFLHVCNLIDQKKWSDLLALDELSEEMKAGRALYNFSEGRIEFPPTFKVDRAKGFNYKDQRIPAYCDRILWSSYPGMADELKQLSLYPCADVDTSDHKPVAAVFQLDLPCRPIMLHAPLSKHARASSGCRIKFLSLRARDLPSNLDVNGKVDPYCIFMSFELFGRSRSFRTPHIDSTLNPEWAPEDLPSMVTAWGDMAVVRGEHVVILVMDRDALSRDDTIGYAAISLAKCYPGCPFDFEVPITKYGRKRGFISGSVIVTPNRTRSVMV